MTRRRPTPDTRLDWRDPEMPVIRNYVMGSGEKRTVVDHDYERRYHEHLMSTPSLEPHWSQDPTYHLKRSRK